ncbi:MAG TPA: hypothetical protein VLF43_01745 [Candidatus Saccharimonadales bacterium]|nr:hypothetical protein [Candidatus Saccharimonadales bacterium]
MQKHISQKIAWALLCGGIVWITLLVITSVTVITPTFKGTYDLQLGPLVLNHFSIESDKSGLHSVTFGMAPGLIGYFALWAALGVGVGYVYYKRSVL